MAVPFDGGGEDGGRRLRSGMDVPGVGRRGKLGCVPWIRSPETPQYYFA